MKKITDSSPRDYINTEAPAAEGLVAGSTYGDRMLFVLTASYSFTCLGALSRNTDGALYFRPGFDGDGGAPGGEARMWVVSENGGELNVAPVNCPDEMRSVPYTTRFPGRYVDGGTMASRIAHVVRGDEIDYDFVFED